MSEQRTKEEARQALCTFIESLKPAKRNLLQHLLDHFNTHIPRKQLIDQAYRGFRIGNPENSVAMHLSELRKQLDCYGLVIDGERRLGSRLRWKSDVKAEA